MRLMQVFIKSGCLYGPRACRAWAGYPCHGVGLSGPGRNAIQGPIRHLVPEYQPEAAKSANVGSKGMIG